MIYVKFVLIRIRNVYLGISMIDNGLFDSLKINNKNYDSIYCHFFSITF